MCPKCLSENESNESKRIPRKLLMLNPLTQVALFIVGWLGLSLVSTIVLSIWAATIGKENQIPFTDILANLNDYPGLVLWSNVITYLIIFVIMLLLLISSRKSIFKTLKDSKPYLLGIIFGVALVTVNFILSYISSILSEGTPNNNQSSLQLMIGAEPIVCLIIFGVVGPIVEELTYRVGLFAFLNRTGKLWLAYVISVIFFALIHFDFGSENIINEFINLPSYLAAGLLLCYAYQKGGLTTSSIAHIINNVVSVSLVIIANS
jgi:membrane protease YdiL (CAAX protease family)